MKEFVTLALFDLPGASYDDVKDAANRAAWDMHLNGIVPQVGSYILFEVDGKTVIAIVESVYYDLRSGYEGVLIHLSHIEWYT